MADEEEKPHRTDADAEAHMSARPPAKSVVHSHTQYTEYSLYSVKKHLAAQPCAFRWLALRGVMAWLAPGPRTMLRLERKNVSWTFYIRSVKKVSYWSY